MPWGAVAGAVIGGVMSNQAAKKGAGASQKATDASIAEQRRQLDLTRQDQMPWLDAGKSSLAQMAALNSGDFSSFKASPDYQFTFDQGMKGLDRSAAKRGSLYAGGTDADRIAYGQGMASQQYGNYYGRLASLAGVGQSTASGLGGLGMGMANNISNALEANGRARASSYQQQGDNWAQLASGAGNAWTYYRNRNKTPGG